MPFFLDRCYGMRCIPMPTSTGGPGDEDDPDRTRVQGVVPSHRLCGIQQERYRREQFHSFRSGLQGCFCLIDNRLLPHARLVLSTDRGNGSVLMTVQGISGWYHYRWTLGNLDWSFVYINVAFQKFRSEPVSNKKHGCDSRIAVQLQKITVNRGWLQFGLRCDRSEWCTEWRYEWMSEWMVVMLWSV